MRELREQLRKREQLEGELEAMRNQVSFNFFKDKDKDKDKVKVKDKDKDKQLEGELEAMRNQESLKILPQQYLHHHRDHFHHFRVC